MSRRNRLISLFVILLASVMLLGGCAANASGKQDRNTPVPDVTATPGPLDAAQELADYFFEHGELPDNFVTKQEAKEMGWQNGYRYVGDIEPGLCIGGDYFGNYERKLPVVKGRKYYEADCFYNGGPRNEYRIIYSSDGHVWFTRDHYETFTELFPSEQADAPPDPE